MPLEDKITWAAARERKNPLNFNAVKEYPSENYITKRQHFVGANTFWKITPFITLQKKAVPQKVWMESVSMVAPRKKNEYEKTSKQSLIRFPR